VASTSGLFGFVSRMAVTGCPASAARWEALTRLSLTGPCSGRYTGVGNRSAKACQAACRDDVMLPSAAVSN